MAQRELLKQFEQYLLENGFRPGDKLPGEQELAAHFKVARSTIREIITHLTLQGLLERRTNHGTTLVIPQVENIGHDLAFQLYWLGCSREELKSTRLKLESAITPEVIRCITPTQLDRLASINRKMMQGEREPEKAEEFDLQFHLTLFEITGNRLLQSFSQVISLLFSSEHRKAFRNLATVRRSVKMHDEMIQAIRNKDLAALQQVIYRHITPL